ncbi:hypothetical protein QFZ96_000136 [Paraburkholderia youngii]|uniref:Uncharacterized protein n=1 Tax=Paraburkholderia youngii TaxID=2782701 RepID=A0A7W8L851_9BURK|nr:hypothetical protein [Paraburkholderia youngii]
MKHAEIETLPKGLSTDIPPLVPKVEPLRAAT